MDEIADEPRAISLRRRPFAYLRAHWRRLAPAAALVVGIVGTVGHGLGGLAGFWEFYHSVAQKVGVARASTDATRPFRSMAVLPLRSSPADRELAARVTRSLTTAAGLAASDGYVVSYGMAQKFAEGPRDPAQAGSALNVRYVLDGELIAAQAGYEAELEFIDTKDGARLWHERLQVDTGRLDNAAATFRNKLKSVVAESTRKEIASLPKEDRRKWELLLKVHASGDSIEDHRANQALLEEALRIDPDSATVLIDLGVTLEARIGNEPAKRAELMPMLEEVSGRATRSAPRDPRAWSVRSRVQRAQYNWTGAFAANDEASKLDPYRARYIAERAVLLLLTGRGAESLPLFQRALDLDPSDPDALIGKCSALIHLARDAEALPSCEQAASQWNWWGNYASAAIANANSGNMEKAAYWKRKLMDADPAMTVARVRNNPPSDNPDYLHRQEHALDGLRNAGVPEGKG